MEFLLLPRHAHEAGHIPHPIQVLHLEDQRQVPLYKEVPLPSHHRDRHRHTI